MSKSRRQVAMAQRIPRRNAEPTGLWEAASPGNGYTDRQSAGHESPQQALVKLRLVTKARLPGTIEISRLSNVPLTPTERNWVESTFD